MTSPSSKSTLPHPEPVDWHWVDDSASLAQWCERWRQAPALALDTEFVRERTFYPGLGLLQVNDGDDVVLVDPLAVDDLAPFAEMLADPSVVKVLHSCSEDLEVFHHHLGVLPASLFDTQVAASLAGLRQSMGYGKLVAELCGANLPKAHTRSNWLARPLSDAQLRYAALDVVYLLPIYRQLRQRLIDLGRLEWLEEDLARLLRPERFEVDELAFYRKIGRGRRMRPRQLAVLRALAVWREREARRRDRPRSFVLKDAGLTALAARHPTSMEGLRRLRDLDRKEVQRHGATLVRLVREALELPEDQLPEPFPPAIDLTSHRGVVESVRAEVRKVASDLGLAPELLASRRTLESLVRRFLDGKDPVLPRVLRGWRSEVVGDDLVRRLERHFA